MQATRYCAFNKTREIFLSLDIPVLDAAHEPLKVLRVLIEGPDAVSHASLWLTHFKAIPVARVLSPFDLIYLDRNYCVVHAVALTVDGVFKSFEGEPACALALPPGTISTSATQAGDQLVIAAQPEAQTESAAWSLSAFAEQPNSSTHTAAHPPAEALPTTAHSLSVPPELRPYLRSRAGPNLSFEAIPETAEPAVSQPALPESGMPPSVDAPSGVEYYREPAPALRMRLLRWLLPRSVQPDYARRMRDRRRAYRLSQPDLVAYFFTGGAPHPCHVDSISVTGFYMKSDHLWMPGTIVRMTLQRVGTLGDDPKDTVTVHSRVVRHGADGGAFEFVLSGFLD